MSQKQQIALLVVLVLILAGVGWYLTHPTAAPILGPTAFVNYAPLGVESPAPRLWEIDSSRKTEYSKSGIDIFHMRPIAAPVQTASTAAPLARHNAVGPQQAPPPIPPTLPLTFFGYGTIPNGTARRAFLTNHEEIYIVGEGDTLLGRFRILKISNATIEFEEISTNLKNTAPLVLEEAGAAPSALAPAAPAPPTVPVS